MKKLRPLFITTVAICVTVIYFTGCKKYDDPGFSLLGPETRLNGVYLLDEVFINDIDSTEHVREYYEHCRWVFSSDVSEANYSILNCANDSSISWGSYTFTEKNRTLLLGADYGLLFHKSTGIDFEINRLSYQKRVWMTGYSSNRKIHLRLWWLESAH